jgi:Leucine Rich repeat
VVEYAGIDGSQAANKWRHNHLSMRWVIMRGIRISHLHANCKSLSQMSDRTFEASGAVRRSKLWTWKGIKNQLSTTLYFRGRAPEIGVSVLALTAFCGKLLSIDLDGCRGITDIGVSVLARGCHQLQSINLGGCRKITDIGVSALGRECGYLQSVDLSRCEITDIGVSALAHGCGQLQSINLRGCSNLTDIGLSALAHGCGQLHFINLHRCDGITVIGVSALAHGCGKLQSIHLCYSDEVYHHCHSSGDRMLSALLD